MRFSTAFILRKRLPAVWQAALALGMLAAAPQAFAQGTLETYANTTNPGAFTEAQRNTAAAVNRACVHLSSITVSGDQVDLLNECRRMVRTANFIVGAGATDIRLGTSPTDSTLAEGLKMIAPEELAAQGTIAADVNAQNVTNVLRGRLSALRAGATGLSFNGIQTDAPRRVAMATDAPMRGGGAGENDPRMAMFINLNYNMADKDATAREDGFEASSWGITGGADYRVSDAVVIGGALSYLDTSVDIDASLGSIRTQGLGLSGYASASRGNGYVDGFLSYVYNKYDSDRNVSYQNFSSGALGAPITRVANGETNGHQFTLGIGGGYDMPVDTVTFTPHGRLEYLDLTIDDFDESGAAGLNLHVDKQSVSSLQSAIGVRAAFVFNTASGVFRPQIGVEWNHEFDNKSRSIVARYLNDPQGNLIVVPTEDPDRNFFTLSLGLAAQLQNGVSAFINYSTIQGLKTIDHHSITLGARWEL